MMTSLLWLAPFFSAAQAAPDRVADTFSAGSAVEDIRVDNTNDWVSAIVDGEVWLLSARTWSVQNIASVCSGGNATATLFYENADTALDLYVGCDTGAVDVVSYAAATGDWSLSTSSVGSAGSGDTGDTGSTDNGSSYDFGAGVLDLQLYSGTIYALVENSSSGGSPVLRSMEPGSTSVNTESSYAVLTTNGAFIDGAINENTGQYYVMHSSDNVSVVTVASGALTSDITSTGGSGQDIAVFNNYIVLAGGNRGILTYTAANIIQVALLDAAYMSDVTALGSYDNQAGIIAADADSGELLLYGMSTANLSVTGGLVDSISYTTTGDPVEMVELARGETLVATDAGEVMVLTEAPWVEITDSDGEYDGISTGSSVSLAFSSDEEGDWELQLGEGGTVLASGTVTKGGSSTATFTVEDGQLAEGVNELWLVVEDGLGNEGHDVYEVEVDSPPAEVTLDADGVGFGTDSIIVQFDGISDEDLSYYDIYVSLNSFAKTGYASSGSGGPDFCTSDGAATADSGDTGGTSGGSVDCDAVEALSVPVSVEAEAGASVYAEIEGVENGYTYYVAVRAVDAGGLEGPMSTVRSVVPQESYSAAELAGETGGFCGSSLPASMLLAGLGGLLVGVRRRRSGGALLAGMVVVGVTSSSSAHAEEMAGAKARTSPWTRGSSLVLGSMSFDEGSTLPSVYGDSGNLAIGLTRSISLRHILELEAGTGFTRSKGYMAASDGTSSSSDVRLSVLPVSVAGTLRLDFFDNQPVVPYASVGGDYWLWRENWDTELKLVTADAIGGGKLGYHWAVGGQILLDIFDQGQASVLEARRGIKDSYLTFEYRNNNFSAFDDEGLVFDGVQLSAGLRFDY